MTKQAAAAVSPADGKMNASSGVRSPRRLSDDAPPLGHGRSGPPEDLSVFMGNRVRCGACRAIRELIGGPLVRRLHVVVGGDEIAVTEADDLHNPGRTLSGRRILDGGRSSVFRLQAHPHAWVKPDRHASAAGVAVLGWRDGRRTLQVFGAADGLPSFHDCLIDAAELAADED